MHDFSGREYHERTKHSWASVRRDPHRLDWERRPVPMKFYPESFPRTPLSEEFPAHTFIHRIGGITAKKSYPGIEYHLRSNPSAGALYPNELYFQARDVEGFDDGIYHFEVGNSSAVRLHPLGKDEGLEPFLNLRHPMRGLLFFVSSPWYRSAWKYRDRAYRYSLLDAGHLLGGIEAGSYLYKHTWRILYDIDLEGLDRFFGFGREEFFLSAAIVAVPERSRKAVLPEIRIEQVDPSGVFEPHPLIETAHRATMHLAGCRKQARFPGFDFNETVWGEVLSKRRSARNFSSIPMKRAQLETIVDFANRPVPSDCDEPLRLYAIVNRVEAFSPGIYRDGEKMVEGDFSREAAYLCLEQSFVEESGVTFFLLSDASNYRALCQKAGIVGHRIYLAAEYLGLGCSGIGAYYDDDVGRLLKDDGMVLYALAVGSRQT
ncbi:nitroreductase family protein [Hydrogenimonas sp.]